jgi:hypothetical protein
MKILFAKKDCNGKREKALKKLQAFFMLDVNKF